MTPDAKAAWLPIPVAVTIAIPAYTGFDIPVAGQVLFADRAAQLAATVALGMWAARTASAQSAVLAAGLFCVRFIFVARGFTWPSYTWPAVALCSAVLWSMIQLQAAQRNHAVAVAACFGITLWTLDSFVMTPWCGAVIKFNFAASTACGSAWGDYRAMVPTLLILAGWLLCLRKAGQRLLTTQHNGFLLMICAGLSGWSSSWL